MEPSDGSNGVDADVIASVLDDAPVTLGVLYGSHARGDAVGRSDIDLAVEFDATVDDRLDTRIDLITALSRALGVDDIHVVPLSDAPPSLLRTILHEGRVVFGPATALDAYRDRAADADAVEGIEAFDRIVDDVASAVR